MPFPQPPLVTCVFGVFSFVVLFGVPSATVRVSGIL